MQHNLTIWIDLFQISSSGIYTFFQQGSSKERNIFMEYNGPFARRSLHHYLKNLKNRPPLPIQFGQGLFGLQ
jgi:hypothetical protein